LRRTDWRHTSPLGTIVLRAFLFANQFAASCYVVIGKWDRQSLGLKNARTAELSAIVAGPEDRSLN
jgi:hypothetical protein